MTLPVICKTYTTQTEFWGDCLSCSLPEYVHFTISRPLAVKIQQLGPCLADCADDDATGVQLSCGPGCVRFNDGPGAFDDVEECRVDHVLLRISASHFWFEAEARDFPDGLMRSEAILISSLASDFNLPLLVEPTPSETDEGLHLSAPLLNSLKLVRLMTGDFNAETRSTLQ